MSLSTSPLPQDCCSELEAIGAGAPHVQSKEEKDAQIERDVPRMAFKIGSRLLRGATGSDVKDNIRQKLVRDKIICKHSWHNVAGIAFEIFSCCSVGWLL